MAKTYGHWEIFKSIDEGGQGRIFLVNDTAQKRDQPFVLKVLKNEKRKDRFAIEIKAVGSLNHPNILRIEDFDIAHDKPYYVAEYCEGGSLAGIGGDNFKGNIEKTVSILNSDYSGTEQSS